MTSQDVLEAAETIRERAIACAQHQQNLDPAVAADLLDEAAQAVARAVARGAEVRDLENYLYRAFLRRMSRARRRSTYGNDLEVALSEYAGATDPSKYLEARILVYQLLRQCDTVTQVVFHLRLQGHSWNAIGARFGITGHAAQSKHFQHLHRARRKLGLKQDKDGNLYHHWR